MIPYIGGKARLSSWIINQFPSNYKELTYCEVFGGGGWVLFKKEESRLEVYNDLNSHLVNLFKVIRDNFEEFQHRAEWSLHSREMYLEAKEKLKEDKFLNDIEKAMHYSIGRVQAFSGNGGWAYQVTADKITSGKWLPFLKRISLINARLKRVQIECLDFEQVIKKYDSKNTLFYLDPPYVDAEFYYNNSEVTFKTEDHERLAHILKRIKGKFLLSYYDHELVYKLWSNYKILKKETTKSAMGQTRMLKKHKRPKATELLIMNC
ncbi:MAG: DNA adenine methylase [Bacteroidota bacterium]